MSSNTSIAIVGILVAAFSPIFTLAIKGFIDSHLESKKALLTKDSKLFERRLDAIVALYGLLRDTEAYYGCLTSRLIRAGESPKEEIAHKAILAYQSFAVEYFRKKVLLPEDLASHIDALLKAFSDLGIYYTAAISPFTADGEARAANWDSTSQIMHTKVPELLARFETECRSILEPRKVA